MLSQRQKIAFHVPRSICHLGLFQFEGISISSHLQVIVTVEQLNTECVCVLWRCGTFQGLKQHTCLKTWHAATDLVIFKILRKICAIVLNICN